MIRRDTLVVNVSLEEMDHENSSDFFSLVPEPEQLGQVKQKIIDMGGVAKNENLLLSVACFLYPKLHERGEDARFEEIMSLAKLISDGSLETPSIEDIVMLVTDLLMELAENGDFEETYELPNLENSAIEILDQAVFHLDRYFYLSDCHFREICEPLLEVVSYRDIKSALREAGILQGSGSRYVSKMYFWQSYGVRSSANMLKFDMELIEKNDEKLKFYFY